MKKSIIALIVVVAVIASATFFVGGWLIGPTMLSHYGHGWGCRNGHDHGDAASHMWDRRGSGHNEGEHGRSGCCRH